MMEKYIVEINGDNNSFSLEVTPYYEPCEDWLTGNVSYNMHIDNAMLIHGSRRRDVTSMLTDDQKMHIIAEIDRQAYERIMP